MTEVGQSRDVGGSHAADLGMTSRPWVAPTAWLAPGVGGSHAADLGMTSRPWVAPTAWLAPGVGGSHAADIYRCRDKNKSGSRPISRVLCRNQSVAIIHLGTSSPTPSSDLPEDATGRSMVFLFGLAPSGVYLAAECCHPRGALLPHHFTLTKRFLRSVWRYPFCCTFRRLTPPRRYLALCPMEPGLSSRPNLSVQPRDCMADSRHHSLMKPGTE